VCSQRVKVVWLVGRLPDQRNGRIGQLVTIQTDGNGASYEQNDIAQMPFSQLCLDSKGILKTPRIHYGLY
jgi:hypothetical protein